MGAGRMRIAAIGVCLGWALMLGGCSSHSSRQLQALSAVGAIQQDAPVKATVAMQIAASPAKVWDLLIDASAWPNWCPQIESVKAPGELGMGTRFVWKSGGTTIHSEVHLVEPDRRLSWTGIAYPARAIHVWELKATPDGGTLVTVKESMNGPLMKLLYSSDKLAASETDWLTALKQAAEKKP
jgi:uncharacterized protein YndB with AHSA1/START domain